MDNGWMWASLTGEQLQLLRHAEQNLGSNVKYLLVYQQARESSDSRAIKEPREGHIAALGEKQLENIQKLEKQLHAVIVAYQ